MNQTDKRAFDQARYSVTKNVGFQDPRAIYLPLRIDQHTTDPKAASAARQALLDHYIPQVEKYDPNYAAGLRDLLLALNELDFTFPENGHRDQIPQPGAVYLKQGGGYHTITGLSIDPRSDEIMVHTRAADGAKNMMAVLVPLADFFEEQVADGVRVRTWREVDPQTGEPIIHLPQELAALPNDQDQTNEPETVSQDQAADTTANDDAADTAGSNVAGDDEATNPNAEATGDDSQADDQAAGEGADQDAAGSVDAGDDDAADEPTGDDSQADDQAAGAADDNHSDDSYGDGGYGFNNGHEHQPYGQHYG